MGTRGTEMGVSGSLMTMAAMTVALSLAMEAVAGGALMQLMMAGCLTMVRWLADGAALTGTTTASMTIVRGTRGAAGSTVEAVTDEEGAATAATAYSCRRGRRQLAAEVTRLPSVVSTFIPSPSFAPSPSHRIVAADAPADLRTPLTPPGSGMSDVARR